MDKTRKSSAASHPMECERSIWVLKRGFCSGQVKAFALGLRIEKRFDRPLVQAGSD